MTIVALMPNNRHASATACAWFPDEYVSTPRARSASGMREIALYAPRNLKAPTRWKLSHLTKTDAPSRASS